MERLNTQLQTSTILSKDPGISILIALANVCFLIPNGNALTAYVRHAGGVKRDQVEAGCRIASADQHENWYMGNRHIVSCIDVLVTFHRRIFDMKPMCRRLIKERIMMKALPVSRAQVKLLVMDVDCEVQDCTRDIALEVLLP